MVQVEFLYPITTTRLLFLLKTTPGMLFPGGMYIPHVQLKAFPSTAKSDDPVRLYRLPIFKHVVHFFQLTFFGYFQFARINLILSKNVSMVLNIYRYI